MTWEKKACFVAELTKARHLTYQCPSPINDNLPTPGHSSVEATTRLAA